MFSRRNGVCLCCVVQRKYRKFLILKMRNHKMYSKGVSNAVKCVLMVRMSSSTYNNIIIQFLFVVQLLNCFDFNSSLPFRIQFSMSSHRTFSLSILLFSFWLNFLNHNMEILISANSCSFSIFIF